MLAIPKRLSPPAIISITVSCIFLQGCAIKHASRSVDAQYPVELKNCQIAMITAVNQGVPINPVPKGCSQLFAPVAQQATPGSPQPSSGSLQQPTDDQKQVMRNQFIDLTVIAINNTYRNYKDGFYIGQASFDTLSDFVVLALTGLTAVTGTSATKAALGAAAAGVTGAHTSVQKNFFENNARDAIFSTMDKLRQAQLIQITQNETLSIAKYPMAAALRDLDWYYQMGTILQAQTAIYSATLQTGNPANPNQLTLPSITTQPSNQTITSGQTATLSVAATGGSLSYQWYRGNSGDTSNPIQGATSNAFTTPALMATTSYWVRVQNSTGNTDSTVAIVTVNQTGAPAISTQPSNQTIASGQTATLSVTAVGTATLTYQWYRGNSSDTTTLIQGATGSTYTTPTLTTGGSYWVRVQNTAGSADSATATITVTVNQAGAPSISTQPSNQTITSGQMATLSVAATGGGPLAYQWYRGNSSDTTNPVQGATSSTLTTPALTATTSYWVRVQNSAGNTDSTAATVTVNRTGAPAISTQPGNQTIASGQTATLSVTAVGAATLTYQWYRGRSGDTTTPIQGATGNTYTTPALTTGGSYWVRVQNTAGSTDSVAATVTVNPPLASTNTAPIATTNAIGKATSQVVNSLSMSLESQTSSAAH